MKKTVPYIAALAAFLASSCVGIDADAVIAADGTVNVSLSYTISSAVDEIGKIGANAAYLPLPVGQGDMELAAARAGGRLEAWSRKDGETSFVVSARLSFPSGAAFAAFLDPKGELASFSVSGGRSTLKATLSDGVPPADPEIGDFIRAAFADYVIALRIQLPKAPTQASGFTVSGQKASFSMKAADLYLSPSPTMVSLTW